MKKSFRPDPLYGQVESYVSFYAMDYPELKGHSVKKIYESGIDQASEHFSAGCYNVKEIASSIVFNYHQNLKKK